VKSAKFHLIEVDNLSGKDGTEGFPGQKGNSIQILTDRTLTTKPSGRLLTTSIPGIWIYQIFLDELYHDKD
jgi:hypothetical protein